MSITLGSNISSLRAQRQLSRTELHLSSVFERLSSGQRINRASDDAAGLAIADSLKADSRVYAQGIRNLNDGISVLNIADGALSELSGIVIRLQELAEQSANGVYSSVQREALDVEAQTLKDEYSRISKTTEFNGRQLFTGAYGQLNLQAAYSTLSDGVGGAIGTGAFENEIFYSAGNGPRELSAGDFNGDGILDIVTADDAGGTVSVLLGTGDGSFGARQSYSVTAAYRVVSADLNGDGILDIATSGNSTTSVLLGNGDGSFSVSGTYSIGSQNFALSTGDFNGDGKLDLVAANYGDTSLSVLINNGDGSFQSAVDYAVSNNPFDVQAGDFNGDGILDLVTAEYSFAYNDSTLSVLLGNGDGTFGASTSFTAASDWPNSISLGDFNGDGELDIVTGYYSGVTAASVYLGNGDGTFDVGETLGASTTAPYVETGDFNGDGFLDVITLESSLSLGVQLGNGDGTFGSLSTFSTSGDVSLIANDFNGDGVLDIATVDSGSDRIGIHLGSTTDGVAPLLEFSLKSQSDALQALSMFQNKIDQLSSQRGEIGAYMARVGVADRVLQVSVENFKGAESRIRDADIAVESSQLARLSILQQAAASVLGQANQQPALALQLLR